MGEPVLYIKDAVDNPHPVYAGNVANWEFLLQSYEGGVAYSNALITGDNRTKGGWINSLVTYFVNGVDQSREIGEISGNLFRHPKEKTQDYNRRLNMSYYYNFCSPVIDIYKNHLFKDPVVVDFKSIESFVKVRAENIDNMGSSIQEFRKKVSQKAQMYGHIFVLVDMPKSKAEINTLADQLKQGLVPYFTIIQPQNMINWSLDENGLPYWILYREYTDCNSDITQYDKSKNTSECSYVLWTRTAWARYDKDFKLIEGEEGTHDVGEVPIACVFDKRSDKVRNFLGISSIADIAFIARNIYNSCSELGQILRDQTFAFLALQGNATEYNEVSLGTGKGLLYPEGRNLPAYVSPPADNAEVYFKHIDRQVSKIYQLAKLNNGGLSGAVSTPGSAPGSDQSGVSKAWDFNETNSALSEKASNLEDGETKLWQLFAKWLNKEFDGSVQYPNEFSVSSIMDDISEAEAAARLDLGETYLKMDKVAIQKKRFPSASPEELKTMEDELVVVAEEKAKTNDLVKRYQFLNQNKNAIPTAE